MRIRHRFCELYLIHMTLLYFHYPWLTGHRSDGFQSGKQIEFKFQSIASSISRTLLGIASPRSSSSRGPVISGTVEWLEKRAGVNGIEEKEHRMLNAFSRSFRNTFHFRPGLGQLGSSTNLNDLSTTCHARSAQWTPGRTQRCHNVYVKR